MNTEQEHDGARRPRRVSRRHFVKLAAATALLAGCRALSQPAEPMDSPTQEPASPPTSPPDPTSTPASTAEPTLTPEPTARPDVIRFYPEVPSKVIRARHAGVWDGGELAPEALRGMLDTAITGLTGLGDAAQAWGALFAPHERIAIKVNVIGGSSYWTHLPLVMAVAESLQDAGVPAEQIVIFDRNTSELQDAGYPVNPNGPGVRCYGTNGDYASWDGVDPAGWLLVGSGIQLSNVLLGCDALINVPILKQHGMSGISFAMKNHYGTFDRPWDYHNGRFIEEGIAELNALAPIKERTRLVIGDVLNVVEGGWHSALPGDSILMTYDPVAHDTVGLGLYLEAMADAGRSPRAAERRAAPWLANAAALGVGTDDMENIDLVEVNVS